MLVEEVLLEDVATKVVLEVTPDEVCVVGFVLGVGVFDKKGGGLDAEVMPFSFLEFTGPREVTLDEVFGFGREKVGALLCCDERDQG